MTQSIDDGDPARLHSEEWRTFLLEGHAIFAVTRRLFRLAPASPRCATCFAPFQGIGGKVLGGTWFAQSRKAPRFCCGKQPPFRK